jgi:peptidylprolyl isomerase
MTLQKGDFILIDYVAKIKETNEVFDTTKDEVAKKEHLHKEGEINEPKLVVVGEGWVLKALDDAILTAGSRQSRNRRDSLRQSLRST